MNLDNPIRVMQLNAERCMPTGAGRRHKVAKSTVWAKEYHKKDKEVIKFSVEGACQGDTLDVLELGLRMAELMIREGNVDQARKILDKIELIREGQAMVA